MSIRSLSAPSVRFSSNTTLLTNSGTANVKGAWAQLHAGLPFDCQSILFRAVTISAAGQMLIDIGVGAGGEERILVENFHVADPRTQNDFHPLYLPIYLPKGSRLSTRSQANNTSTRPRVDAVAIEGNIFAFSGSRVDTYGADTSDSGGTQLTPNATANVFGTWAQLSAAIPRDIVALYICIGNQADTVMSSATGWRFQVGIGASGQEISIIDDLRTTPHSTTDMFSPTGFGPFPAAIPAGTRLAARTSSSSASSPDFMDIVIYGLVAG